MSFLAVRSIGIALVQVDTFQAEFILQVKMSVYDDALMILFWNKCQESFCIHGCSIWFSQMENVKSLFE